MGVVLSLFVVAVGVIEALSCYHHFQIGLLRVNPNNTDPSRRRSLFTSFRRQKRKAVGHAPPVNEEARQLTIEERRQIKRVAKSLQLHLLQLQQQYLQLQLQLAKTKDAEKKKEETQAIVDKYFHKPPRPTRSISLPEQYLTNRDDNSIIIDELAKDHFGSIEEFDELYEETKRDLARKKRFIEKRPSITEICITTENVDTKNNAFIKNFASQVLVKSNLVESFCDEFKTATSSHDHKSSDQALDPLDLVQVDLNRQSNADNHSPNADEIVCKVNDITSNPLGGNDLIMDVLSYNNEYQSVKTKPQKEDTTHDASVVLDYDPHNNAENKAGVKSEIKQMTSNEILSEKTPEILNPNLGIINAFSLASNISTKTKEVRDGIPGEGTEVETKVEQIESANILKIPDRMLVITCENSNDSDSPMVQSAHFPTVINNELFDCPLVDRSDLKTETNFNSTEKSEPLENISIGNYLLANQASLIESLISHTTEPSEIEGNVIESDIANQNGFEGGVTANAQVSQSINSSGIQSQIDLNESIPKNGPPAHPSVTFVPNPTERLTYSSYDSMTANINLPEKKLNQTFVNSEVNSADSKSRQDITPSTLNELNLEEKLNTERFQVSVKTLEDTITEPIPFNPFNENIKVNETAVSNIEANLTKITLSVEEKLNIPTLNESEKAAIEDITAESILFKSSNEEIRETILKENSINLRRNSGEDKDLSTDNRVGGKEESLSDPQEILECQKNSLDSTSIGISKSNELKSNEPMSYSSPGDNSKIMRVTGSEGIDLSSLSSDLNVSCMKGSGPTNNTEHSKVDSEVVKYDEREMCVSQEEIGANGENVLTSEPHQTSPPQPRGPDQEAFWLIFSGEYTKAMNKDWCNTHFSCWQCDEPLTGQRYVLRDDHPYCIKCYENVFANICEECNKKIGIDSKDLSYKDKHWHEACFLCNKCRVSLVDKQFGSKAEKIYCGNCYDTQFASHCDGCGEIFRAGTKKMEYKTRQWHEKCFCCCVCKKAIGTNSFIPKEQEIYCSGCYEEKFATRCIKCKQIITSGGVTYKNEPWHRDCFTCSNCTTSLAGQRFTSRDEKPYCANCFGELFAKKCTSCCRPITGIGGTRFISFEDRHWHNDCFICAECRTSLVGRGFITNDADIICPECAKQKLM